MSLYSRVRGRVSCETFHFPPSTSQPTLTSRNISLMKMGTTHQEPFSSLPALLVQTQYDVSMLICPFVSLRVACVKLYHARPRVERNVTLCRQ